MKYLLRLSYAFALVVGLIALAALFLPGRYSVRRDIAVAAAPARVFAPVADLGRWREWNVWLSRDPAAQVRTSPVTTGAGAWLEWRSARQGAGRVELVEAAPPELVRFRLVVDGVPVESRGAIRIVTAAGGRTIVTWDLEGDLGYRPTTRWFGLMLGPLLGGDLERSLAALKDGAGKAGNGPEVRPPGTTEGAGER